MDALGKQYSVRTGRGRKPSLTARNPNCRRRPRRPTNRYYDLSSYVGERVWPQHTARVETLLPPPRQNPGCRSFRNHQARRLSRHLQATGDTAFYVEDNVRKHYLPFFFFVSSATECLNKYSFGKLATEHAPIFRNA